MLDDPNHPEKVKAEAVLKLNHLAKIFRRRRMEAGALTLASPEVRFVLDTETQNPLDVAMYALKETNALVEEFMLLANITVGKKILRHFPTLSLLRRHPAPNKAQFTPLVSAANAVGVDIRKCLGPDCFADRLPIQTAQNELENHCVRYAALRYRG